MAHLQYMPGDQGLIDQLVYELKSKGIFDQFRKDCIADVDTRPAYQNLRQRVESSVTTFLSRQKWKPDLNKNQLREKLRKHILDGNYLEQGVERIVDQVVNPKVASVFIPQVEDLVYNYLGIKRNKTVTPADTSNGKLEDNNLLPTDLEAVSPCSVKSNNEKEEEMDISAENTSEAKMDVDEDSKPKLEIKEESFPPQEGKDDTQLSGISDLTSHSSDSLDIPVPAEIKPENIPPPDTSPPKIKLDRIPLPNECDIPLPEAPKPEELLAKEEKDCYFKPVSDDDDDVSSNSSDLRKNMSPLTPVRNFNDENSCDAKQGFDDSTETKPEDVKDASVSNFNLDLKPPDKIEKKDLEQSTLSYQFENKVNINTFNTPLYEDSSNSNNLQIDYESDANSKTNTDSIKPEPDQSSQDVKKDKTEDKKSSSNKSSHKSRDSHRHSSSSKDKRSDSKHSSSKDKRDDKKSTRDDHSKKSSHRERSRDKGDRKDSRDTSKHRSSHKSSSSHRDSKSHKSSSSSQRHSSKHDDKKSSTSSSSHKEKSDKSSSKDHKSSKDSKSSSHRSDKDRKSSSSSRSKSEKDKDKKDKKITDDHYSLSRRGNINRRSTDRDSNDGNSTSSKGSNNNNVSKAAETKKDKTENSKSGTSSSSGTSPSDNTGNDKINQAKDGLHKPVVRIENHLEMPVQNPPLRFMPEVVLKKPKFASNFEEARKMMKMRKFLDDEQRRMNQEAALLLEFQANVRPNLSQVYSNISGPELEFACVGNEVTANKEVKECVEIDTAFEETVQEEVPYEDEFQELDNETIESIAEIQKEVDNITNNMEEEKLTAEAQNKIVNESFEVTIVTDEEISDSDIIEPTTAEPHTFMDKKLLNDIIGVPDDATILVTEEGTVEMTVERLDDNEETSELYYFDEQEKHNADSYKYVYAKFLKTYTNKYPKKLFLINCDSYCESLFHDVSKPFGDFQIISYHRNGHTNLPKAAKNIDFINKEIALPLESPKTKPERIFSPVKSECSFELSSDYDAKLEDMVNTTSRQQIMEIILGGDIGESPTKMPRIDICNDSNIEMENDSKSSKRPYSDVECNDNNNQHILTPSKIRRTSGCDQITSTTDDTEELLNNHINNSSSIVRSKYLGRARRVGLPRPRKSVHANSPSSDKSVENYAQNLNTAPVNGKVKQPRNKVQRYDTSDLYKPKLHFLSRRNNIS